MKNQLLTVCLIKSIEGRLKYFILCLFILSVNLVFSTNLAGISYSAISVSSENYLYLFSNSSPNELTSLPKPNLSNPTEMLELTGKVTDSLGQPLELVAVSLLRSVDSTLVQGAITDSLGVYNMEDVDSGVYFLKASALGFEDAYSDIINVESGQKISVPTLILMDSPITLEGVVVTANTALVEKKSDRFVIKVKESAFSTGSSIDLIKTAPFVSLSGTNEISLQGKRTLLLVDDKQIPDDAVAITLQTIPAGNIASIELITTPSSKYDAMYGAVVNIVTKKGRLDGYTGSIRTNGSYGELGGFGLNSSITYKEGNLITYGTVGYQRFDQKSFNSMERVLTNSGISNTNQEDITRIFYQNFYSAQVGVEYELDNDQKIGALVTTNPSRNTGDFNSRNEFSLLNEPLDSVLVTKSPFKGIGVTSNYNLNYNLVLDSTKTELSIIGTYTRFRNNFDQFFSSSVRGPNDNILRNPVPFQTFNDSDIDLYISQVDFVRKFKNDWKLETGIKNQSTFSRSQIIYEEENSDGDYFLVPEFSNDIILKETISAAYAILYKNWEKDEIQLGMRMESTKASYTGSEEQEYLNLFPTLFYQRNIDEKHNLSLSYRKTITRAPYNELVPYTIFINNYTVFTGNPALLPQYDDIITLGVNLGKLNLSANYISIDGMFGQFPSSQDFDSGVTFFSLQNLERSSDFYIDAFYPIKITSWWSTQNSGTLFGYSKSTGTVLDDEFSLLSRWFNFRSNHTFKFSEKLKLEVSASYSSALTSELTRIGVVGNIDASFQLKLFKGKGQLNFGVWEILGRNIYTSDQFFNNYRSEKFRFRDSQRVNLGFSYNFGKLSDSTPTKKLGNDDAINRIQQ